jgi:hypothetical protein
MHESLSLPEMMGRLTRVLLAFEESRRRGPAVDAGQVPNKNNNNESKLSQSGSHDLQSLSLGGMSERPASRHDDLDTMGLSRVEELPSGRPDGLGDSSLSRPVPPRLGP